MIEDTKIKVDRKDIGIIILRSIIGGMIGSLFLLLYSALSYLWSLGFIPYLYLFIIPGIPLALFVGVLVGIIVGTTISILHLRYKKPNIIIRITVGVAVIMLARIIMSALSNNQSYAGYPETIPLAFRVISSVIITLALGALPAAMARPQGKAAI